MTSATIAGGTMRGLDDELLRSFKVHGRYDLVRGLDGRIYLIGRLGRGLEAVFIGSNRFRAFLNQQAMLNKASLSSSDIRTIRDRCEELALQSPPARINVRVAEHQGKVYLDLADRNGRCVEISSEGWKVLAEAPVPFFRSQLIGSLPPPEEGLEIEALRAFLNVCDGDFDLILAWLTAVLSPDVPCPVLMQIGSAGCGKTTNARLLKMLVDPASGSGTPAPEGDRDLVITAGCELLQWYDNVSSLSQKQNDALCRLTTGAGYRTRALYTDADIAAFEVRRPIMMTAVRLPIQREDLASRSMLIEPPKIQLGQRRTERQILEQFRESHPRLLGGLLSMLSRTLAARKESLPESDLRMADFTVCANQVAVATGRSQRNMQKRLEDNAELIREEMLQENVLVTWVGEIGTARNGWEGTAAQLDKMLNRVVPPENRHELPRSLSALSRALDEAAPLLRYRGIEVRRTRTGRSRKISISRIDNCPDPPQGDGSDASDADGEASQE